MIYNVYYVLTLKKKAAKSGIRVKLGKFQTRVILYNDNYLKLHQMWKCI